MAVYARRAAFLHRSDEVFQLTSQRLGFRHRHRPAFDLWPCTFDAAQEAEAEKGRVLDAARREAQEIRSQATRDAERIAQEVRSRAEQEAAEIRMKAQGDAQKQAQTVLADANKQIADLAILATEQLLGRELANRSEQQRFVTEFLAQQQNGGGTR